MEIRRFYTEDLNDGSTRVELRGEEFLHLKKVLRLTTGAKVILLNGRGIEAMGTIVAMTKQDAVIRVEKKMQGTRESPLRITLIQGLLKGENTGLVAEKSVELDVSEVRFFISSRTVARADSSAIKKKIERLKKVSISAVKQCERTLLPKIGICEYKDALDGFRDSLRIVFSERDGVNHIKTILEKCGEKNGQIKDIALIVGPEGGLTDEEMDIAAAKGFVSASMGPIRLRAETAAIAALAIIGYALGGMGRWGQTS
ncbi:MAG: 16S rRNA (uracil(1498)-N(3))-methyltransferase [Deltaproteobacteria bacterium]|nr:16S rRNA (uracil(1498)-N(3))-methyltransferase [Deltaproteobacteria bacterium]